MYSRALHTLVEGRRASKRSFSTSGVIQSRLSSPPVSSLSGCTGGSTHARDERRAQDVKTAPPCLLSHHFTGGSPAARNRRYLCPCAHSNRSPPPATHDRGLRRCHQSHPPQSAAQLRRIRSQSGAPTPPPSCAGSPPVSCSWKVGAALGLG